MQDKPSPGNTPLPGLAKPRHSLNERGPIGDLQDQLGQDELNGRESADGLADLIHPDDIRQDTLTTTGLGLLSGDSSGLSTAARGIRGTTPTESQSALAPALVAGNDLVGVRPLSMTAAEVTEETTPPALEVMATGMPARSQAEIRARRETSTPDLAISPVAADEPDAVESTRWAAQDHRGRVLEADPPRQEVSETATHGVAPREPGDVLAGATSGSESGALASPGQNVSREHLAAWHGSSHQPPGVTSEGLTAALAEAPAPTAATLPEHTTGTAPRATRTPWRDPLQTPPIGPVRDASLEPGPLSLPVRQATHLAATNRAGAFSDRLPPQAVSQAGHLPVQSPVNLRDTSGLPPAARVGMSTEVVPGQSGGSIADAAGSLVSGSMSVAVRTKGIVQQPGLGSEAKGEALANPTGSTDPSQKTLPGDPVVSDPDDASASHVRHASELASGPGGSNAMPETSRGPTTGKESLGGAAAVGTSRTDSPETAGLRHGHKGWDRLDPVTDAGALDPGVRALGAGSPTHAPHHSASASQALQSAAAQIFNVSRNTDKGELAVRLNPEELGRLKISFSTRDAGLAVTIHADRPETVDLIRRHVGELVRDLKALGLEPMSVDVGSSRSETFQRPEDFARPNERPEGDAAEPSGTDPATAIVLRRNTASSGLDLRL